MAKRPVQIKKKTAARRTPRVVATASGERIITIRAQDREGLFETDVTRADRLERLAQEWTYILRARARWVDDPDQRQFFRTRALHDLESVGVSRAFVRRLASVTGVEIELHKWNTDDADATRIHEAASEIPWEYLVSAGTRGEGRFQSMLITRLLRGESAAVAPHPPRRVLFVESAPGRLKDLYEFEDEEERIGAAVRATGKPKVDMLILRTPQVSELEKQIQNGKWEAIHVTGIDTHLAAWCIEDFYEEFQKKKPAIWNEITNSSDRLRDGMLLREGSESELPVRYDKLAKSLVNTKTPPHVITLNLYYSGARVARELVKLGAHAALGFLDEIDDEYAELFFQAFYWEWCRPQKPALTIPETFLKAWKKMHGDRLHGTAIVIWLDKSLFETNARSESPTQKKKVVT